MATKVGCGHMMCTVFYPDIETKLNDHIDFYVCKFNPPEYHLSADEQNRANRGRCFEDFSDQNDDICSRTLPFCVVFESDELIFKNQKFKYCGKKESVAKHHCC